MAAGALGGARRARAFAVCLLVPFWWALCFAATAAVGVNALGFNGGACMDKLIEPLVAIVLLCVMLKLPLTLARVAMLGGQALSGGFVSRAVSYAAGRSMTNAAGQHLPAWAGGQATKQSDTHGARDGESRTGGRLRNAATWPAPPQRRAPPRARGPPRAARPARRPRRARRARGRPPGAPRTDAHTRHRRPRRRRAPDGAAERPAVAELPRPRAGLRQRAIRGRIRARTSPVSGAQARGAAQPARRHAARRPRLVAEHGAGAREHLAYQALGEWTPDEREALRTLAAASPDVRAEAIHDVLGHGDHDDAPVPTAESAPSQTAVHEQSGGGTIDAGPEPTPRPAEPHDVGADGANGHGTTIEPATPAQQPGTAAGREGGGGPAREQRGSDPDILPSGGHGGEHSEPGARPPGGQAALLGVHGRPDRRRVRRVLIGVLWA